MDLWTDLNSGADWGLDLLSHPDGLFGDLKDDSRLKGDMDPACKPGDAVEQMVYSPKSEGGPLDFEWMESGDLGSFLDALDNGQDRLSQQDSLFDCSQELDLKDNVSVIDGQTKLFSSVNSGVTELLNGLTPPESPEQVTPIIKLDPEINDDLWTLRADLSSIPTQNITVSLEEHSLAPGSSSVVIQTPIDILDEQSDLKPDLFSVSEIFGLSFASPVSEIQTELVETKDKVDEISYAYSSDDGSSELLSPESHSPRPSIDSLIQSSPELYKVIATPLDISARFSPYSKSKGDLKVKSGSKKTKTERQSPEPVDEDDFPSNLGKKERKKLQNKNAAIRYRQKKKAEVECIATEVQGLEDKNSELKTKVDDLQREVKYMKSLMEDIFKAKGLVN